MQRQKFDALALTVDTITGGNRRFKTGLLLHLDLILKAYLAATSPSWTLNYLFRKV